jgi:hypothetical protein
MMEVTDFINPTVLESNHWVYPALQWKFPPEYRWDYVKKVETMLLDLVGKELGWNNIEVTEGYCPSHDATAMTPSGVIKIEVKTTDKEKIFIEGGRIDKGVSGLSATEADVYVILSRNMEPDASGNLNYSGKVRIVFTNKLVELYLSQADTCEFSYKPSENGPISTGINVSQFDLPHIWIGDVYCIVEDGYTRYKLSKWKRQYREPGKARAQFYNQLPKILEENTSNES